MAKGKRKVTVESGKQGRNSATNDSTPPRRPSVFERLGPGSSGTSKSNIKSIGVDQRDKGHWARRGGGDGHQFGNGSRYQQSQLSLTSTSKQNKKSTRDKNEDLRTKVTGHQTDSMEIKDSVSQSDSPNQSRPRGLKCKREPETKIRSQVVVTSRKAPSGRADDRETFHSGDWRVDRSQLDFEEELILEKKRQQLQRELELEMQKERLMKHESVVIQKRMVSSSSSTTSSSSSSSSSASSSSSSSSDGEATSSSTSTASSNSEKKMSSKKTKKANSSDSSSSSDDLANKHRSVVDDRKVKRESSNQRSKPMHEHNQAHRREQPQTQPKKRSPPSNVGNLRLQPSQSSSQCPTNRQGSGQDRNMDKHLKKKKPPSTPSAPHESGSSKTGHRPAGIPSTSDSRAVKKSPMKRKLTPAHVSPTHKGTKKPHKLPENPGCKSDVKKPTDLQATKGRSPKRESIPIQFHSSDNERDVGTGQGHSHARRSISRERRLRKLSTSPMLSSVQHSAGHCSNNDSAERNNRKARHVQPAPRKGPGMATEVQPLSTGKKMKDRDQERIKEQERTMKDYDRVGRHSPHHMNEGKRQLPIRPRPSPPPRNEKQSRGRDENRGGDGQWHYGSAADQHEPWSAPPITDKDRFSEARGPHSPPRKDRDAGRRMKYEEPSHSLLGRPQLHDNTIERSRDVNRRSLESLDDRYPRRENQPRMLPEVRQPLLSSLRNKSPESQGLQDERLIRGTRPLERDRRPRPADDPMHHLGPDLLDRRRPPSPPQDSKYHMHHRKLTPPGGPPAPPSTLPSLMHHPIVPGRYPSPLDWQQDRGRRNVPTYSPEGRKGRPPSPIRHDLRYEHEEPVDLYDYRRERNSRDHPQPMPVPLLPSLSRHIIDKAPRQQDRFQSLRGPADVVEAYDRESSRSQHDYSHDDQRHLGAGRHSEKWENRRDTQDSQRGHLRNEPDHPSLQSREPFGRRREDEMASRKRPRDEPNEKLPLPKRRKDRSPGLIQPPHDHSHIKEMDNPPWNRPPVPVESGRRANVGKPQSESAGTPAGRNAAREKSTARPLRDQRVKDTKAPVRSSRPESGEKDHQVKRPVNKDPKVAVSESQKKPSDNNAQKRKRVSDNDQRPDKKKKPDEVPKAKENEGKKAKAHVTEPSGTTTSKPPEKPTEPEATSTKEPAETDAKASSAALELAAESYSDLSDDSLDLLNQNESPQNVEADDLASKTKPESDPKPATSGSQSTSTPSNVVQPAAGTITTTSTAITTTIASAAATATAAASTVITATPTATVAAGAIVAVEPPKSSDKDEKADEVSKPAALVLPKSPSKRHKARSEGGDDSRGSFEDFGGRGRSKDRIKTRDKSGRSSHPSSRHTSLERPHLYHCHDKERSRTSTSVKHDQQPATPSNPPPCEQRVENKLQELADPSRNQTADAPVAELPVPNKADAAKEKSLESYEYDPISDDELEALLEEPNDKENKVIEAPENKPDALEVDWASLVGDKLKRPVGGPRNSLQNFTPAYVIARVGISVAHAGPALMNRIHQCLEGEAVANEKLQSNPPDDEGQNYDVLPSKGQTSKFQLEHDIAAFHSAIVMQKREREAIFDNIGPYRQALCARRDLLMRRKLGRLRLKLQENSSPLLSTANVDHDMLRISLQLFRQQKLDAVVQPLPSCAIPCL